MQVVEINMANPNVGAGGFGGGFGPTGQGQWNNDLFSCCTNCNVCFITCCFPCVQFGMNRQRYEGADCCMSAGTYCCLALCGLCCLTHVGHRRFLREKYQIQGTDGGDCLVTCCCPLCAICQEANQEVII